MNVGATDAKILALCGARGGSKGLVGKNIHPCAGKPLIAWTIEAALGATSIDRIVVSTDSQEIADVARAHGADVPFLRPEAISGDAAPMQAFIDHALEQLGGDYTHLVLLHPTCPLRTAAHIDDAVAQYFARREHDSDTMVSVYPLERKAAWTMTERDDGCIDFLLDVSVKNPRRQELPTLYMPNGAFYMASVAHAGEGFYTARTLKYEMPPGVSVDVDVIDDLRRAEALLTAR